jgi:hypothetical protein
LIVKLTGMDTMNSTSENDFQSFFFLSFFNFFICIITKTHVRIADRLAKNRCTSDNPNETEVPRIDDQREMHDSGNLFIQFRQLQEVRNAFRQSG